MSRPWIDAHTAQSVQPQWLPSGRRRMKKFFETLHETFLRSKFIGISMIIQGNLYTGGKGMVPHVQLSTNDGLGCLLIARIFSNTPTANSIVGWWLDKPYSSLPPVKRLPWIIVKFKFTHFLLGIGQQTILLPNFGHPSFPFDYFTRSYCWLLINVIYWNNKYVFWKESIANLWKFTFLRIFFSLTSR